LPNPLAITLNQCLDNPPFRLSTHPGTHGTTSQPCACRQTYEQGAAAPSAWSSHFCAAWTADSLLAFAEAP